MVFFPFLSSDWKEAVPENGIGCVRAGCSRGWMGGFSGFGAYGMARRGASLSRPWMKAFGFMAFRAGVPATVAGRR